MLLISLPSLIPHHRPRGRFFLVSLLILQVQATLDPLGELPAPTPAFIDGVDFANPMRGGGSLLSHDSGGLGEPLNIIISGRSSDWVLTDDGFVHFANAIGFGKECFGSHLGAPQTVNLGDGNDWANQTMELRDNYGIPYIGTWLESVIGGNHLRMWRQNGPWAHTNALFLAVSEEKTAFEGHNIAKNGYNVGRDVFVKSALTLKKYRGVKYSTVAQNITGLILPGSTGVNRGIPTDGVVVLLTVTVEAASGKAKTTTWSLLGLKAILENSIILVGTWARIPV